MPASLPRPGVEVIQTFESASPTIVIPTLVPCIVAPFHEVIEVTTSSGTTNENAKLTSLYDQNALTIPQLSFPSPRSNIAEVDVDEATIRGFLLQNGSLVELSKTSGFLVGLNSATAASVAGSGATYPVNLDGLRLTVAVDAHRAVGSSLPNAGSFLSTDNVNIDFTGTSLTLANVISQINARIPNLASDNGSGQLRLTSTRFGARSSVLVRGAGSANTLLGLDAVNDEVAVGAGFYAIDDADGDITSPRIEFFTGTSQRDIGSANSSVATAPSFLDSEIAVGDTIIADGTNIGNVDQVFANRLVMEVEQNIFSSTAKFAPRYFWVQANGLSFPAPSASSAGTLTGTVATSAATVPYIVSSSASTFPVPAGEAFTVDVTLAGVAQATENISSGTGWADISAVIAGINAASTNFEAYRANIFGDELPSTTSVAASNIRIGLRLTATNTGKSNSITLSSQSTGLGLGFATPPVSDVGEDIRYKNGTPAIHVGGSAFGSSGGPMVSGETLIFTPTVNGAAQSAETVTWSASHTDDASGLAAAITDWNNQALHAEAYEANASGVETTGGLHFAIRSRGENVGTDAIINITGGTDLVGGATFGATPGSQAGTATDLNGTSFTWRVDGNPKSYSITLGTDEDDDGVSLQQVIDRINLETVGVASASSASPPALTLTSRIVGEASSITVVTGTANSILGFSDNATNSGSGRPAPDLAVDTSGNALLQANIIRDGRTGLPYANGSASMYMAYKGLRLDVTPNAATPGLLRFSDTASLTAAADPISTDNPGAAMVQLALLNSPGTSVAAIGVPEVSADSPEGTSTGYASCFSFLESEEVYAVAVGTQDPVIHSALNTHVNFMSGSDQKGERIAFNNRAIPTRRLPTLLSSGTDANTTATPGEIVLDVNVAQALVDAGLDPADINDATGAIENEVYLDFGTDANQYLVQSVTGGTTVTLRTTFATGENADSFYATAAPSSLVSDTWTLSIRGTLLLVSGTTNPDKDAIAETVQLTGQALASRRVFYTFPDQVGINLSGVEQLVPGYYGDAVVAGMVANQPPQQGFTNLPMAGLTRVKGSSDTYSNRQLNVMAAGGVYIWVQDAVGGPVSSRHQLSTDMTSIEARELSITKVVDFTAKFVRNLVRNFIGRSNITQAFIDQISTVVEGAFSFLKGKQILSEASVNNIVQDSSQVDRLLVDVTLDVPFPCNYIRVTLVV